MTRVLSLFSGIGGLDLGFEAAGMDIVGSVESDDMARLSLGQNRSWPQISPHDVDAVDEIAGALGDTVDVIIGAPPCQPFSKAAEWHPASRAGLGDDRGLLIYSVLDLVERLAPKLVILENVQGFVRGRTSVIPAIAEAVSKLAVATGHRYQLEYKILDAHEFGTPQHRRRAIVALSRIGPFVWPDPVPVAERPVAWDAIGDLSSHGETPSAAGKWAELLPSIPEGWNYQWHTNRAGGLPLFGYRTRYWSFLLKLAKDQPAWTLAAQPGPSTGPFHWDSRPLTANEMLRLQGFPEGWKVLGDRREVVRQIGNATPPALAEAVARCAVAMLGGERHQARTHVLRREGTIPRAVVTARVPGKYQHLLATDHDDHPGTGLGPAPRHVTVGT
jgi:DNA (cytosine-5)-methyltransferase 1